MENNWIDEFVIKFESCCGKCVYNFCIDIRFVVIIGFYKGYFFEVKNFGELFSVCDMLYFGFYYFMCFVVYFVFVLMRIYIF